ncbi:MAG: hypothetical protein IJL76_03380 [Bacilli bacterium]|nr:hypothetical protein [Bacilli bacterium]
MSKRVIRVENNVLSLTDVIKLNALAKSEDIIVEIENTKGQNSEIFKKFSENITISILGGLNYVNKDKYNDDEYRVRTFYKPREVSNIIKTFEYIERKIDPAWNQLEKAMYVYKVFVENLNYNEYHNHATGIVDRNLLVLKNRRGVCAGFALLYKEAMDRLGIPCEYQNRHHHHCWNVLKLDDKYIAVDMTWDIEDKKTFKDNKCHFKYFGTDQDFYSNKHHNIFDDKDEEVFPITTIPEDVLREAYQHIIKNKSYKAPIKEEAVNGKRVEYAMEQIGDTNLCLYRIDNQLYLNNYQNGMSKEQVFIDQNQQYNYDDITMPQYRMYRRDDNSTFCLIKDKDKENGFIYCDFDDQTREYRSYRIYSESDLIKPTSIIEAKTIANNLLKPERLIRKVDHFNGYVGFIKARSVYYDSNYEKETLNIVNRK